MAKEVQPVRSKNIRVRAEGAADSPAEDGEGAAGIESGLTARVKALRALPELGRGWVYECRGFVIGIEPEEDDALVIGSAADDWSGAA
jgi:hypothetical protein